MGTYSKGTETVRFFRSVLSPVEMKAAKSANRRSIFTCCTKFNKRLTTAINNIIASRPINGQTINNFGVLPLLQLHAIQFIYDTCDAFTIYVERSNLC